METRGMERRGEGRGEEEETGEEKKSFAKNDLTSMFLSYCLPLDFIFK